MTWPTWIFNVCKARYFLNCGKTQLTDLMNVVDGAKHFCTLYEKVLSRVWYVNEVDETSSASWTWSVQLQHVGHASSNTGTSTKFCATRQQANAKEARQQLHSAFKAFGISSVLFCADCQHWESRNREHFNCAVSHAATLKKKKSFKHFFPLCFTRVPQDRLFPKSAVTRCFSWSC